MLNIEHLGAWEQLQKKLTWEQLGEFEGKTILEFGCGNGIMGAYYAINNTVIAIEPDNSVIEKNVHHNVKQICGDIRELKKIKAAYFDIILCHNVFEYADERAEIMAEFEKLLKPNGLISILKHNVKGRVMQTVVLLDDFKHANDLLDSKNGMTSQYGEIKYYQDEDLIRWAPCLKIEQVLGMRTFWDLQQNQEKHLNKDWQKQMMELEQKVSCIEPYIQIAFFHHIFLTKR